MTPSPIRVITSAVAALALAASGAAALAAPAEAAGPSTGSPAQSAEGNLQAPGFSATFNANRAAGAPEDAASGTLTGHMTFGPTNIMTVSGPVTCLDVVGHSVGLFYPITKSTPVPLANISGVYLAATLGANGRPKSFTFVPVPFTHASSCAPMPTLIPVTSGTLTLTSGHSANRASTSALSPPGSTSGQSRRHRHHQHDKRHKHQKHHKRHAHGHSAKAHRSGHAR